MDVYLWVDRGRCPLLFAVEGTPFVVFPYFFFGGGVDSSLFAVSCRETLRFTLLIRRRTAWYAEMWKSEEGKKAERSAGGLPRSGPSPTLSWGFTPMATAGSCPPRWSLLRRRLRWSGVWRRATRTTRGWTRVSRECPVRRGTRALSTSPTADAPRNLWNSPVPQTTHVVTQASIDQGPGKGRS